MSRPLYERPVIARHQTGAMNKFSRAASMQPQTHIDGVPVQTLVEAYGSPVFVFSEKTLVARYRELRDAFARKMAPSVLFRIISASISGSSLLARAPDSCADLSASAR